MTTTGTVPRITNTNRVDMYAIVAGTQGLTKSGTGILYLWRPNTYTGVTTISTAQIYLRDAYGLGATVPATARWCSRVQRCGSTPR